jgi:molybdenum cofactor cytidylyltransferase
MFSSVKEGFRHVRGDRFFFTPGDYPAVSRQVYVTMANVTGDIVIPIYKGQKGHPVLMKGCLARDLVENTACTSLREFIDARGFMPVSVQDPGILTDIDTMDDYKRIVTMLNRS